jgi:hypothetical protein
MGVVSAGLVLATQVMPGGAFADGESSGDPASTFFTFSGVAAADGARFHLVVPGAPASNDVIDSGGPTAQAVANSVGTVRGIAAFPYPGETGLTLMSTGAGALGSSGVNLPAEPPAYPFAATSDHPGQPEQTVGGGPFQLHAVSNERGAEATATAGLSDGKEAGASLVASTASVKQTADGVVSSAMFRAAALAAGPVTFGRVVTKAMKTMKTSGETSEATSLEVLGADVGGTKFSLTSAGLTLAGTAAPLPIEPGLKSLNEQLAHTGAAVRFSPERKTAEGVIAPVFEVVVPFKQTAGFDGTLTITFGGAGAFLQGAKTGDPEAEAAATESAGTDSTASTPGGFASEEATPDNFGAPSAARADTLTGQETPAAFPADVPPAGLGNGLSAVTPDSTAAPVAETSSSPVGQETVQLATLPRPAGAASALPAGGVRIERYALGSLYAVIAVLFALGFTVSQFVSRVGVRRPWRS